MVFGGKDIPAKMAQLAKKLVAGVSNDGPSSPNPCSHSSSDGLKIQVCLTLSAKWNIYVE
jgi:hypothetical protein